VNRWRQRLAELHGDAAEHPAALPRAVQNVQNVQNRVADRPFEHFEQIEQRTEPPACLPAVADPPPATWGEAEAERAAIVERDGAISREWAEGFARLDRARPPGDVPPRRWQRFVDDVGHFLDGPFCAIATALGWDALHLLPSWYVLATQDQTVPPDLQHFVSKRMKAATTEVTSSHVPMLSKPDVVLDVIRKAANTVSAS
jgi:pimeloyl-ACP methyl ester carboxylesterase